MNLCRSLFFNKIDNLPLVIPESGEFILCIKINTAESSNIEPDPSQFLGNLLYSGQKINENPAQEQVELPQGHYLFTQCRTNTALNKEEWLDLAIEQQKDGLWERNKLKDLLYIRFLYEDGAFVTQIYRGIADGD